MNKEKLMSNEDIEAAFRLTYDIFTRGGYSEGRTVAVEGNVEGDTKEYLESFKGRSLTKETLDELSNGRVSGILEEDQKEVLRYLPTLDRLKNLRVGKIDYIPKEDHDGDPERGSAERDLLHIVLKAGYTPSDPLNEHPRLRTDPTFGGIADYLGWDACHSISDRGRLPKDLQERYSGKVVPDFIWESEEGERYQANYCRIRRALRDHFPGVVLDVTTTDT